VLRKMKANHPVDPSMAKGFDATSKSARRLEQPTALQPAVDGASPTAVDIPVSGLEDREGCKDRNTHFEYCAHRCSSCDRRCDGMG